MGSTFAGACSKGSVAGHPPDSELPGKGWGSQTPSNPCCLCFSSKMRSLPGKIGLGSGRTAFPRAARALPAQWGISKGPRRGLQPWCSEDFSITLSPAQL